jgi:CHAT domain-containing protein/tetratricopeptide (TPR) repeat protein
MDDSVYWALVERLVELGDDPNGLLRELRQHRELLLSAGFQAFLEDVARELEAAGDHEGVDTLEDLMWLLDLCREAGIELAVEARFMDPPDEGLIEEFWDGLRRAEQLEAQFEAVQDEAALDAAIELVTELVAHPVAPALPHVRLASLAGLASLRGRRYRQRSDLADLEAAIRLAEQAAAVPPPGAQARVLALMVVSEARRARYAISRSRDDLDRAVDAAQAAVAETSADSTERPRYGSELGAACLTRYEVTGDVSDLEGAVTVLEEAARTAGEVLPADHADLPMCLAALAAALWARYRQAGNLADLERATVAAQRAVDGTPPTSPDRAERLTVLGMIRWACHVHTRDQADGSEAVAAFQAAVDAAPAGSAQHAGLVSNLAGALVARASDSEDLADADRAVNLLENVLADGRTLAAERPNLLANLGMALQLRQVLRGQSDDTQRAVELLEEALAGLPAGAPLAVSCYSGLGLMLIRRHAVSGHADDARRAADALRRACSAGLLERAEVVLDQARMWAIWAGQRGAWEEMAEAGGYGLAAMEQLLATQLLRGQKEAWLRRGQGLPAMAAYALARVGETGEAVTALERGLALLLSEALSLHRTDLTRLAGAGNAPLVERYRRAADRWERLAHDPELMVSFRPGPVAPADGRGALLRAAREELGEAIAAIRAVPGWAHFLAAPRYGDVRAAATSPLVYLAATQWGGLALVVRPDEDRPTVIWLPELTEVALGGWVSQLVPEQRSGVDPTTSEEAVDGLTRTLWRAVMAPVLTELGPRVEHATLIPAGGLALLPLHAAWTPDPSRPTGRRYALDELLLTWAPNVRALAGARTAAMPAPQRLLVVEAGGTSLPNAAHEAATAVALFAPAVVHLGDGTATLEAIKRAVHQVDVLHMACHAHADVDAPLDSAMVLHGSEQLTVGELLTIRLHLRLAILSACETFVPGSELPDEVVGLPTALLQAGAAGVVGTLWKVLDRSTLLLMVRFYQGWRLQGLGPAEALRRAQQWLRDSSNGDKRATFEAALKQPDPRLPLAALEACWEAVALEDPDERRFADPTGWAAFTYMGR